MFKHLSILIEMLPGHIANGFHITPTSMSLAHAQAAGSVAMPALPAHAPTTGFGAPLTFLQPAGGNFNVRAKN